MTKLPSDPPDLNERRRGHLQRNEAAIKVLRVDEPEIQKRLPGSNAKIKSLDDWLVSDDYDPEIGELIVGDRSAQGSFKIARASIEQAERAMQKDYGPRNKLLKAIAKIAAQKRPSLHGERRNDYLRDLIIKALKCRVDRLKTSCTLDEWFGDEDEEIYNDRALEQFRKKTTGEVISGNSMANILSSIK